MSFDREKPLPDNLLLWMVTTRVPAIVAMVVLSLLSAALGLGAPFFQKLFVDRLTHHELAAFDQVMEGQHPIVILLCAFGSMLLAQWVSTATGWLGIWEALKRQEWLALSVYRKALSLRLDQATRQPVGETVSLYATDVPGSTSILDQTIPIGAGIVFPFVCAPLAVKYICGIPVGSTVIVMLSVLSISILLSIRQSKFFQTFKRLAADRTALVNEWIQNIRLLRILGWVDNFERKIFNKREEETVNRVKMVTNGQMMGAFGSSINFFLNLAAAITLARVKGASATPGDYFALLWIFGVFLSRPFRQVPWIFTFTFDGLTSIRRLEEYFRKFPPVTVPPSSATASERFTDRALDEIALSSALDVSVENLSLQISNHEILKSVSFRVKAGEFVAIVGEVGSGKSLLLMSLLGETGATFDELKLGGINMLNRPLSERRRRFGFIPQDGFVMSASLRENVAFLYDVGAAADPAVLRALKSSQFNPTQEGVTDGLDTEIGERGVNLSGGQRQRVGLARSSYLRRPVMLLDDALSAVDVETERLLFDSLLLGEWRTMTRIMVTHRLSVLEKVDRIFYLRDGTIDDQGSLMELELRNESFRQFVRSLHTIDPVSPAKVDAQAVVESDQNSVITTIESEGGGGENPTAPKTLVDQ